MVGKKTEKSWFVYFPGNYRWSSAVLLATNGIASGGADFGEVHSVGQKLMKHSQNGGNDEVWFEEWVALGDDLSKRAREAERKGSTQTAAKRYLRAACYYQIGERFRIPKDGRATNAYRKAIDSFHKYANLTKIHSIEAVNVPMPESGGKSLPAYFIKPWGLKDGEKPPCVVFFDGLDITKELQYIVGVPPLLERGLTCLVIDGPGNGEAIRLRGLKLRPDFEVAGSAAIDYLKKRDDLDSGRVGVMGISLGGYYASRCASLDKRYKACVCWGAIWDYHKTWKKRLTEKPPSALSVPATHINWILGSHSFEESLKMLKSYKLDGVVQLMRCPFLLLHGENDQQIPNDDAVKLFKAVGSKDKMFRKFTRQEGGAEHCQRDRQAIAVETFSDWLKEKL